MQIRTLHDLVDVVQELIDSSGKRVYAEDLQEALDRVVEEIPDGWQPIATAPRDGSAFLSYGVHDHSPPSAQRGVKAGDHWWAIILWDTWRDGGFVFAKDGTATWSPPTHWRPLPEPPADDDGATPDGP